MIFLFSDGSHSPQLQGRHICQSLLEASLLQWKDTICLWFIGKTTRVVLSVVHCADYMTMWILKETFPTYYSQSVWSCADGVAQKMAPRWVVLAPTGLAAKWQHSPSPSPIYPKHLPTQSTPPFTILYKSGLKTVILNQPWITACKCVHCSLVWARAELMQKRAQLSWHLL